MGSQIIIPARELRSPESGSDVDHADIALADYKAGAPLFYRQLHPPIYRADAAVGMWRRAEREYGSDALPDREPCLSLYPLRLLRGEGFELHDITSHRIGRPFPAR